MEERTNYANKGLVLLGAGGHCKSVMDAISPESGNAYKEVVITDPVLKENTYIDGIRVAGTDDRLEELYGDGFEDAFITVGSITDTSVRRGLYQRVQRTGFRLINIIDETAVVAGKVKLGDGVFVGKTAVLNADCEISDMAIINTRATIEHECRVGAFSHVSIGAILCGNVTIGEDVFVGAGAVIIQGITVGNGAVIGAGSVVLRDVAPGEKVTGIVK